MSKRLFTVELTAEIVVFAEDEHDARSAALDSLRELDEDAFNAHAVPMRRLPSEWTSTSIPYGEGDPSDRDRTIQGWIDQGAAPEYEVKP